MKRIGFNKLLKEEKVTILESCSVQINRKYSENEAKKHFYFYRNDTGAPLALMIGSKFTVKIFAEDGQEEVSCLTNVVGVYSNDDLKKYFQKNYINDCQVTIVATTQLHENLFSVTIEPKDIEDFEDKIIITNDAIYFK